MISNLPWTIRKEIIDYTLDLNHNQYCLLNKEWFNYGSGQFMILDDKLLGRDNCPSSIFQEGQNLKISKYSEINWKFLSGCKNIKSVSLGFDHVIQEEDIKELEIFADTNLSPLNLIYIEIKNNATSNQPFRLLKTIKQPVQTLEIFCHSQTIDFNELLAKKYPTITSLSVRGIHSSVCFDKIHQSMPNIEDLALLTEYVVFWKVPNHVRKTSHLKSLLIFNFTLTSSSSELLNNLFQVKFPTLTIFVIRLPFKIPYLGKISECMPNLKILSLSLNPEVANILFPSQPLLSLEHLDLELYGSSSENIRVQLDLNLLPRLRNLELYLSFNFYNSNMYHQSKITSFLFKGYNKFKYKNICDHLSNLKEVTISCFSLSNKIKEILRFCRTIEKLILYEIGCDITFNLLPYGNFKTTHLELRGNNFLTSELINWLAYQSQLNYLLLFNTTNSYTELDLKLDITSFSNLKTLSFNGFSPENEKYLRYILSIRQEVPTRMVSQAIFCPELN